MRTAPADQGWNGRRPQDLSDTESEHGKDGQRAGGMRDFRDVGEDEEVRDENDAGAEQDPRTGLLVGTPSRSRSVNRGARTDRSVRSVSAETAARAMRIHNALRQPHACPTRMPKGRPRTRASDPPPPNELVHGERCDVEPLIVGHGRAVGNASRAVITRDRRFTGLSANVFAGLVVGLGPLWRERHQAEVASGARKRAVGRGVKHRLVLVGRLLAMLVHLRRATTHGVLACWLGVDCSAIGRAVGEVWSLLAERGAPLARVCGCGPWP